MRIAITGPKGHLASVLRDSYDQDSTGEVIIPLHSRVDDERSIIREIIEAKPDVVIHAAALVGTVLCEHAGKDWSTKVNVEGTRNVTRGSNYAGARLVYFSTTAVYDPSYPGPYSEKHSLLKPQTIYGQTKLEGEVVARTTLQDTLVIRPCFVFGGRYDVSMITALIRGALNDRPVVLQLDRQYKKDYLWDQDFASAFRRLFDYWLTVGAGLVVNIARGTPVYIQEILTYLEIKDLLPKFLYEKPEDDYMRDHTVDTDYLQELVPDWKPLTTVNSGIDQIAATEIHRFEPSVAKHDPGLAERLKAQRGPYRGRNE